MCESDSLIYGVLTAVRLVAADGSKRDDNFFTLKIRSAKKGLNLFTPALLSSVFHIICLCDIAFWMCES
jgi:hypothetical protein